MTNKDDEPPEKTPFVKEIPRKADDLTEWYQAVCYKAELVSLSPVRGCVVLRPYGYGLWERLQSELDVRFKATGHENAYFPLLIPESLLMREAEHVEGFAPEVAWVTAGRQRKAHRAARDSADVRSHHRRRCTPNGCSRTAILPILINQWANVMRWEKRTRPFLRTLEFLWQEGHTAHATEQEAAEEVARMLDVYREVAENICRRPGLRRREERRASASRAPTTPIRSKR